MRHNIYILLLFLFQVTIGLSQEINSKKDTTNNLRKDILFFEFGNVTLASINYERHFFHKDNSFFSFRVGLTPYVWWGSKEGDINVPLAINYSYGKRKFKPEIELGTFNIIFLKSSSEMRYLNKSNFYPPRQIKTNFNALIGFNWHITDALLLKLGVTLFVYKVINENKYIGLFPVPALSIGYCFK